MLVGSDKEKELYFTIQIDARLRKVESMLIGGDQLGMRSTPSQ